MPRAATLTPNELRRRGMEALLRELGPADMVRFLQQFEHGQGDYTREREKWLGNPSVQEVASRLREQESEGARQD